MNIGKCKTEPARVLVFGCVYAIMSVVVPPATLHANTTFIDQFKDYLVNANGSAVDPEVTEDCRYFALYYSASWCGPCRAFTPKLKKFYATHRGRGEFEVILISTDRNENSMMRYMKKAEMPWSAVSFSKIADSGLLNRNIIRANEKGSFPLPYLVIVDRSGKIVLEPYKDGSYIGYSGVLAALKNMLQESPTH